MKIKAAVKVWFLSGFLGILVSLTGIGVHELLTADQNFGLWELGFTLGSILVMALLFSMATKSKILMVMFVALLTMVIPMFGALFGSSGSEPLWQFALLGMTGGLFWGLPFTIWALFKVR
tara:strand:- start:35 stop:394 length:360 start_codon:yes stop_codon:yes gene_type:complete